MNEYTLQRRDCLGLLGCLLLPGLARADALSALNAFIRDVRSGRADFTQTVTSPDGQKKKVSSGRFEFQRPNRFRFAYLKPYPQTLVGDGQKVWIHDPDLNQVTVRPWSQALGSTPAALLAGQSLEREFELKPLPSAAGIDWVQATPRQTGGTIVAMKAGFRGTSWVALEIADSFGQRSLIEFGAMQSDVGFGAEAFRFVPPPGAEVNEG
ncbi:MAG: outer membrane lipoprotein chaperone LolA [Burkholderiales bacterium]|nr:outer membrane lipoprotein chaperone LolA [Burkholderiales bacterium]